MQHALLTCIDGPHQQTARRFLSGLSSDEIEYIADFVGTCVLECRLWLGCDRNQVAMWIRDFALTHRTEPNEDDKALLLFEFLSRCGIGNSETVCFANNQPGGSSSFQSAG
jgi:hypothetical protein